MSQMWQNKEIEKVKWLEGDKIMTKVKFFKTKDMLELESEVNMFIQYKDVINISYTVAECGYGYIHCCCILYRG